MARTLSLSLSHSFASLHRYYGGELTNVADRFLLSFGVRKNGEAYYKQATDFTREIMDGFAAGWYNNKAPGMNEGGRHCSCFNVFSFFSLFLSLFLFAKQHIDVLCHLRA